MEPRIACRREEGWEVDGIATEDGCGSHHLHHTLADKMYRSDGVAVANSHYKKMHMWSPGPARQGTYI